MDRGLFMDFPCILYTFAANLHSMLSCKLGDSAGNSVCVAVSWIAERIDVDNPVCLDLLALVNPTSKFNKQFVALSLKTGK